ncbi:hypothetical protein BDP27DRAFT_1419373 [Rhodocollybia butyracea]|uniref:Uncharacterized protein n=1 Tax=Rhodocollybia butyracea TaxID=206335 RepID=A0A9P5U8L0_9AGAR|nr:hypothetical protein BDP27DRAFT_1419373 [Rhodocollybia butyracea]
MSSDTDVSMSDDESSTRNNFIHTSGSSSAPQFTPASSGSYVLYGHPYPQYQPLPQTPVPAHLPYQPLPQTPVPAHLLPYQPLPQTPIPAHLPTTSTTLPHFFHQPSSQKPPSQATASGFSGDTPVSDPNLRKLENK